jgi:formate-dependent nitrite reductase membrane component NrfD
MRHYFKIFGVLLWIGSIGFVFYIQSVQTVDYTLLAAIALCGIVTGFGFIGLGEIINLLEKQLHQSQKLYELFKQVGGND